MSIRIFHVKGEGRSILLILMKYYLYCNGVKQQFNKAKQSDEGLLSLPL